MLAIEVEYLTGRSVSSDRADRESAEWPPHPGRLFSALVAAAFEVFADDAGKLPAEFRAALEWLERQPPPALHVPHADAREPVPVFVPVNDCTAPGEAPAEGFNPKQIAKGLRVLPDRRLRQERSFPSMSLESPIVQFVWEMAEAGTNIAALRGLASHMTYLGHSSSPVRVAVVEQHLPLTHRPDENGAMMLRIAGDGRFRHLVQAYQRRARPSPGLYCAYAPVTEPTEAIARTVFGEALVFRKKSGEAMPLRFTLNLTRTIRDAVIKHAPQPVPEFMSGHNLDGGPSQERHLAYVPLANVDHDWADGSILGFAVVLPGWIRRFSRERSLVLKTLGAINRIWHGSAWSWAIEPLPVGDERQSLRFDRYAADSKTWASVTPIVCDRYPKTKNGESIEGIIAESCVHIGLPPPVSVRVDPASPFLGVPPSKHFVDPLTGSRTGLRVHAVIEFETNVRGPILLGKSRHFGMGLMRPCKPNRKGPRGSDEKGGGR